jgi:hypothetical protein
MTLSGMALAYESFVQGKMSKAKDKAKYTAVLVLCTRHRRWLRGRRTQAQADVVPRNTVFRFVGACAHGRGCEQ